MKASGTKTASETCPKRVLPERRGKYLPRLLRFQSTGLGKKQCQAHEADRFAKRLLDRYERAPSTLPPTRKMALGIAPEGHFFLPGKIASAERVERHIRIGPAARIIAAWAAAISASRPAPIIAMTFPSLT